MEERILDDEEARKIRLKRTKKGETDAVEDTETPAEEEPLEGEEEFVLEIPDSDEYDEDLVGLTPSQLKEEMERRERAKQEAKEEAVKLTQEGEALLKQGDFDKAADLFAQAVLYDGENEGAARGLWNARTKNFTDLEPLYDVDHAEAIEDNELQRRYVIEKAGAALERARGEYAKEEEALAPVVEGKLKERREAFADNLKYYRRRLLIFVWVFAACVIGLSVSATYILRTQSVLPVVFTAIFGVFAFAALAVSIFFLRKVFVASQLCSANERLSSTEDGARLERLRDRLYAIDCILKKEEPQQ